ncbi:PREDICTED: uveal autoantigen with coiled-coil domains and ankyrin repeats-like isoform X2 [Cyphomyrmex costatus]|uniref:uveal autoantigen with coiled-coil domains and ankyrin repeats-like isoform X2 n=1 Tax=Cyphomyrmex costatus TaxID=456900 RepID=UPI00085226C1|nr:PREDICTED: uveal autoantigen with coiled-coil domains and ankyrin repeats-like isoform X2 [Cyphomyrmex costatus]
MNSDYYSTVYTWFEKCGIVSNIRTHLRQNLVNALKRKDLRLCKNIEARSAKHAPQCSFDKDDRGGGSGHNKLQSDYIAHTLETLGIHPNSSEGQYIISNYMNSETPLLLSILSSIASLVANTQSSTARTMYDRETQANLTLEANLLDTTKIEAMRKKIMQQKQLYDDELKTKESKLKQQATVIKHQLGSLNAKVEEAQNLMQSLTLKEKELNEKKNSNAQCILQKEMELSMKQNFLTQEANRLQRERDSYKKFENGLKKLQRELVKMQKEMSQGTSNQCAQSNFRDIHVQTDRESRTIMDKCRILQREKLKLTNLVEVQRSMIEQITQRSVQLSHQLEEIRLLQPIKTPVSVTQITTAIVSENSSTDDILQDAKTRLKRLEEESSKADQYFCTFVNTSS